MRRLIIGALLVVSAGSARAEKQRKIAQLLSGVGTGVSSALVLGGFLAADSGHPFNLPLLYAGLGTSIVTPSLGQYYAGEWLTIGTAVRIGASGLAAVAISTEQETVTCDAATMSGQLCKKLKGAGVALLGVAAIAWIGGIAYDVADASDAVDRYNRKHGFYVAPTVVPAANGGWFPGMQVGGSF